MLARVIDRELDLSVLPPSTPLPVRRLLARCLERDRRRRMRDAGEAISDLEAAVSAPEAAAPALPSEDAGAASNGAIAVPLEAVGRRRGRRPCARRPRISDGTPDARARTRAARGAAPIPRPAVATGARLRLRPLPGRLDASLRRPRGRPPATAVDGLLSRSGRRPTAGRHGGRARPVLLARRGLDRVLRRLGLPRTVGAHPVPRPAISCCSRRTVRRPGGPSPGPRP